MFNWKPVQKHVYIGCVDAVVAGAL